jgi:hypothetical protein
MVQFLAGPRCLSLFQNVQTHCEVYPASYSGYSGAVCPGPDHFNLVPNFRMSCAVALLPDLPSCNTQGQFYLCRLASCLSHIVHKLIKCIMNCKRDVQCVFGSYTRIQTVTTFAYVRGLNPELMW